MYQTMSKIPGDEAGQRRAEEGNSQSTQGKNRHQLSLLPALQPQAPDLLKGENEDDEVQGKACSQGSIEHCLQVDAATIKSSNDFWLEGIWYVVALEDVGRTY